MLRPADILKPNCLTLPRAPPPSLPGRDYRHFFGAAAILTILGEYGGAQQHLKHGLPSKQKHLDVIEWAFASKTCIICRFSRRCDETLQELVWCSRTTPWQRGLMQQLTTELTDTAGLTLLTRCPHCNRKLPLQCLYLHLLLFPFSSTSLRAA